MGRAVRIIASLALTLMLVACDTGEEAISNPSPEVTAIAPPSPSPSPRVSAFPADPCHVHNVTYCALNAAVTQATIHRTICVSGWTATIRPPSSYTSALKVQQLAAFKYADQNPRDYEEDHRVPLELGGAPRTVSNLSPERGRSPNPKDAAENAARASVCAGRVALRQAQVAFVATWLLPYPRYRR